MEKGETVVDSADFDLLDDTGSLEQPTAAVADDAIRAARRRAS